MRVRRASRRVAVLALLAGAAALASGCRRPEPAALEPQLVIHHFTDWHGHLEPFRRRGEEQEVGGASRLFRWLEARRLWAAEIGADSLLLVAGDVLQGTPLSTVFRGVPDFTLLNRMGVDAYTIGNHDFDFGLEVLQERLRQAEFPVLAANVVRPDGELFAGSSVLLETPAHGLRVAVLGLLTDQTPVITNPRNVGDLRFLDPVATARSYLPQLVEDSDLMVVLSHCGLATDRRLAALEGVDLVVGGHDHRLVEPPLRVGEAVVVHAYESGEYLGEARFSRRNRRLQFDGHQYLRVTAAAGEDPEVERLVAGYRMRLGEELGEELAVAEVRLEGEREAVRSRETNLGDLVTDIVRSATGAEAALINGGAIRTSLEPGPITLEEVMTVLPFDNELVIVTLSGSELMDVLKHSARLAAKEDGGFLQVSGLRVRVRSDGMVEATLQGEALDPQRSYRVALTDFMADGGDGYAELVHLPRVRTGYLLNALVVDWLRAEGRVRVERDGRIELDEEGKAEAAEARS